MIDYNNGDFKLTDIKRIYESFKTIKKEKSIHVYGATNRSKHDMYSVYLTNYPNIEKIQKHLKGKNFTIYNMGVGAFEGKTDRISIGFNKHIREDHIEECGKITWVVHATL